MTEGDLDRLTDDGLIELDHEEIVDSRLRRYCRLSDAGEGALQAETERLRRNVDAATTRLRARERWSAQPATTFGLLGPRSHLAAGHEQPRDDPCPQVPEADAGLPCRVPGGTGG